MSQITFLASARPFDIPAEIAAYNNRTIFENEEDFMHFSVCELDASWKSELAGLFSLPYLYEAEGIGNGLFMLYLEKYMETGDVLEVFQVPNQHDFRKAKIKVQKNPQPIKVNAAKFTYEDASGHYQFHPKTWINELRHRNFLTPYGITTFVKY